MKTFAESMFMTPIIRPDEVYELLSRCPKYQDSKLFVAFLKKTNLSLSPASVENYIEHLEECGYKASTYNLKLTAVKEAIRYLFKHSPDSFDIRKKFQLEEYLKMIRQKKINSHAIGEEKILSPDEVQKLIEQSSEKLGLMIEFLYHTGCRVSEMVGIRKQEIKENGICYIITIRGKGNKERIIKVKKDLIRRIEDAFHGGKYLFETVPYRNSGTGGKPVDRKYVSTEIRKIGKKVLNRDVSAHTLRHSFATRMIEKTGNLKGTSKYLGHSSVKTTLDLYVHSELSFEDLE